MRHFIKFIPNLFTLANLFCGALAVMFACNNSYNTAAYFVFAGAICDFFDGFLARILKSNGELGKQLDSLADVVTFGFSPAVIMYGILNQAIYNTPIQLLKNKISDYNLFAFTAFFILLFSAYRLAKFNIDTRQTFGFVGLPTPANALFIISLPFWYNHQSINQYILNNPFVLLVICTISSLLLVSNTPLLSLKFKSYKIKYNFFKYILIIVSITLLILFKFKAFTFIIPLYITLSIIHNLVHKTNKHEV